MAEERAHRPAARARPVADLALSGPLEHAEPLARAWVAALVTARPLARLGELADPGLAETAPRLVQGVLRALGSEDALDALLAQARRAGPDGGHALGAFASTGEAAALAQAVEALRGVLWEELQGSLGSVSSGAAGERRLAGEVADRLAHVCAELLAGALEALPKQPLAGQARPAGRGLPLGPPRAGIVIHDERLRAEEPVAEATPQRDAAIEIRDARQRPGRAEAGGPASWIRSIGAALERHDRDGLPFAVVLLEIETDPAAELGGLWPELERALAERLRTLGEGTLTSERAGRCWLLLARADRIGAHALAAQLEGAAGEAAARRGVKLEVLCGVALCPEDGEQAAALAAHADVGLYAARWEARSAQGS